MENNCIQKKKNAQICELCKKQRERESENDREGGKNNCIKVNEMRFIIIKYL